VLDGSPFGGSGSQIRGGGSQIRGAGAEIRPNLTPVPTLFYTVPVPTH